MQNKVLNFPNFSKILILFHSKLIILMNTDENSSAENCEINDSGEYFEIKKS